VGADLCRKGRERIRRGGSIGVSRLQRAATRSAPAVKTCRQKAKAVWLKP
jgi:hypothetical protein